ncbi:hypothetical protein M8818_007159 [Zalaria obscura]|uniref:Uncharacterized protein n=1 Tax=Zalaria obscura TaxID=2024903 RepID=A0ACC3S461_9PEZI
MAMSDVSAARRQYPTTKRTNSLGWAQSDCHACTSSGRYCDRRRPRCDACTDQDLTCPGYVQALNWNRGSHTQTRLPASKLSPRRAVFTFVQEDGTKTGHKRRKLSRQDSKSAVETPTVVKSAVEGCPKGSRATGGLSQLDDVPPTFEDDLQVLGLSLLLQSVSEARSPQNHGMLVQWSPSNIYQLSYGVRELLSFYESRFSVTTITFDADVNPWKACLPLVYGVPCLLDAAVAIAKRHQAHLENRAEELEVLELKDRALCSFAANIGTLSCEAMVGASLLLIGLEYADTGLSNWETHIRGAYQMLEACGGTATAALNDGLRSQVTQLLWYDTATALFALRKPVFPRRYVEMLGQTQSRSSWSLLSLNGCPDSLFLPFYDAVSAAAQSEPILPGDAAALEMRLWTAEADAGGDEHLARLIDCFRLALLLYCSRVFRTYPQSQTERDARRTLAEEILWLVSELPATSDLQKQCLMPIVLAGCEVDSFRLRRIALDFCTRWGNRSGIWMIRTARAFLEKAWAAMDEDETGTFWWGNITDRDSTRSYLLA